MAPSKEEWRSSPARDFLMRRWEFFLPIEPVAQGRPRFSRQGRVYDPERSRRWKRDVGLLALPFAPKEPSHLPMALFARFDCSSKSRRMPDHHTGRPDLTNFLKGLEDALSGIFYKDDAQIVECTALKRYALTPGVFVLLRELG